MSNAATDRDSLLTPPCPTCLGIGKMACRGGCAEGGCFCESGPTCRECHGAGFVFALCVDCDRHDATLELSLDGHLRCKECDDVLHGAAETLRTGMVAALTSTIPSPPPSFEEEVVDSTDWWALQSVTPPAFGAVS